MERGKNAASDASRHPKSILRATIPQTSTSQGIAAHADDFLENHLKARGDGAWASDGDEMSSNRYGTGGQPTQPDHAADNRDFGILRKVDGGEVGMRFEDDGLRTTLRW